MSATTHTTGSGSGSAAAGTADWIDQRTGAGRAVKGLARKLFPEHWSFMLGEIALYSLVTLLITGVFLTMFFVPSANEVTYTGPWAPLQGTQMSEAYASTLRLSFEVRGGLLMRQVHHWAALIFLAAIVTHMMRVFFTGAFRKPREINWIIGFVLLTLGLAAGFSGYSLPDDVLSGNGLRITDGLVRGIPIIGTYASYFLFGGEFPGDQLIPRLFTVHVLLVPGLILALVGLHLAFVFLHKHTQFPGSGRSNSNVVGYPLFPVYVAKAGGFFFVVFGVIALLGATMQINPVWAYGSYDPGPVSAGAQPDWYMLFLEGALRLMPGQAEWVIAGYTVPLNVLIPGLVVPLLLLGPLALYPFIEAYATGDTREHHLLDRPRNAPFRTAFGMSVLTAFFVLVLAGSNDLIATRFHLSINDITWTLRVMLFVAPAIVFVVTRRVCLALYLTPCVKVAAYYASYSRRRSEQGHPVILEFYVPNSLIEGLPPYVLEFGDQWKQIVWNCRRGDKLPRDLKHIHSKPLIIAPIASCHDLAISTLVDYHQVSDRQVMYMDGSRAIQYVFQQEETMELLQESAEVRMVSATLTVNN